MLIEKHSVINKSNVILLFLFFIITSAQIIAEPQKQPDEQTDFFDMSIEELMEVPVVVSAS